MPPTAVLGASDELDLEVEDLLIVEAGRFERGRSVEFRLCEVYQFRDGKIISARTHFDSLGLMTQLGAVPLPGQGVEPSH